MQRYFVDQENWLDESVKIDGDDYHHIVNVMRMKSGDKVICNHQNGTGYLCSIDSITDQTVELQIIEKLEKQVELPIQVTLIQGLAKGDKLEWIVQKSTELGVDRLIPLQSKRAVVKWDQKKQAKKIERLQRIAKEAAEQSHRTSQPIVTQMHSVKQLISSEQSFDHKFVAYEEATRQMSTNRLNHYLEEIKPGQSVAIVIGPEGGFASSEVEFLMENNYLPIRLGARILRTETASLYFLSALSYLFEESN